jgi:phasin
MQGVTPGQDYFPGRADDQARAGMPRAAARNASRIPPSELRITAMSDETPSTPTPKAKPKVVAALPASVFEMPKFEIPKFEMPKMEVPTAFREMAEKGIAQAKEQYEKVKAAAEEATDMLEDTYATASKGCSGYGLKLIENARANTDAAFDLMTELVTAKSYADMVEFSSSFMRKQFEALTAQSKELAEHATKVATETVEPLKEGLTSAFKKAA